ncbi:MAG: hypothetical protein WDN26_19275 [Chitinophagaceae bacterium]
MLSSEQNDERSVATDDHSSTTARQMHSILRIKKALNMDESFDKKNRPMKIFIYCECRKLITVLLL